MARPYPRGKTLNFLETPARRKVLFAALYASEGAPIGYLWWALPTQLKSAGVAADDIGQLAALLALPWALKVLWAPVVPIASPNNRCRSLAKIRSAHSLIAGSPWA
ncbi:MAG: hypothetical protein IPK83_14220 [Planctomycetes bacterium]|nr:hypothetical protein [Planctomycetota bacterium]